MDDHDEFVDAVARKREVQPFIDDTLFEWIDTLLMIAAKDAPLASDAEEFERARGRLNGWVEERRALALPVDADRERTEPLMSVVPLSAIGPLGEMMGAAASLLRECEDAVRTLEPDERMGDAFVMQMAVLESRARDLRDMFDKYLPGWDSDDAGLDLN